MKGESTRPEIYTLNLNSWCHLLYPISQLLKHTHSLMQTWCVNFQGDQGHRWHSVTVVPQFCCEPCNWKVGPRCRCEERWSFLYGGLWGTRIAKPKRGAQEVIRWSLHGLVRLVWAEFRVSHGAWLCYWLRGCQWPQNWELDCDRWSEVLATGESEPRAEVRETGLRYHRGGPARGIRWWSQPELRLDVELKEQVGTSL